jgi:predicted nucleotide-binding protein (sugar kinase/HSP70/actin superfamily)
VDDACLPVKIFHGHVMDLAGKVDMILIPRLISVHPGEFICPKFIGLPEMIKNDLPSISNLLVLDFNAHGRAEKAYDGMKKLGRELGASLSLIHSSLKKAQLRQEDYKNMLENGSSPQDLLDIRRDNYIAKEAYSNMGIYYKRGLELRETDQSKDAEANPTKGMIGLIGHPYLVYDTYINMNICRKLKVSGYEIVYPENCGLEEIDRACARYPKKLFWSYGKRLLGSGLSMMRDRRIQGLILITSFACGIDAFIDELLIRANNREFLLPLTTLTLDEHTGEAGFDTRLEAFIDMMEWRNKYDNHFSPHGSGIYSGQGIVR